MIQRIQSLWLLLALISTSVMFFLPLAEISTADADVYSLNFENIKTTTDNSVVHTAYSLAGLIGIVTLLSFISLFLFKYRNLQMRICMFNSLLIIGIIALTAYFTYFVVKDSEAFPGIAAILPLIAFIFTLMARRAVKKDEELIKSVDRIR